MGPDGFEEAAEVDTENSTEAGDLAANFPLGPSSPVVIGNDGIFALAVVAQSSDKDGVLLEGEEGRCLGEVDLLLDNHLAWRCCAKSNSPLTALSCPGRRTSAALFLQAGFAEES